MLLQLALGLALGAVFLLYTRRGGPECEGVAFAVGLVGAAVIYIGFAPANGAPVRSLLVPVAPGVPHTVAIRFSRDRRRSLVEYLLDGKRVTKIDNIGIPLDVQGVKYSGIYPSRGRGEPLRGQINSVVVAHGLFSLLDAFPFQYPEAPALSVSLPMTERLFGQGVRARFANVVVTTEDQTKP